MFKGQYNTFTSYEDKKLFIEKQVKKVKNLSSDEIEDLYNEVIQMPSGRRHYIHSDDGPVFLNASLYETPEELERLHKIKEKEISRRYAENFKKRHADIYKMQEQALEREVQKRYVNKNASKIANFYLSKRGIIDLNADRFIAPPLVDENNIIQLEPVAAVLQPLPENPAVNELQAAPVLPATHPPIFKDEEEEELELEGEKKTQDEEGKSEHPPGQMPPVKTINAEEGQVKPPPVKVETRPPPTVGAIRAEEGQVQPPPVKVETRPPPTESTARPPTMEAIKAEEGVVEPQTQPTARPPPVRTAPADEEGVAAPAGEKRTFMITNYAGKSLTFDIYINTSLPPKDSQDGIKLQLKTILNETVCEDLYLYPTEAYIDCIAENIFNAKKVRTDSPKELKLYRTIRCSYNTKVAEDNIYVPLFLNNNNVIGGSFWGTYFTNSSSNKNREILNTLMRLRESKLTESIKKDILNRFYDSTKNPPTAKNGAVDLSGVK